MKKTNSNGFTLIELLISMTIFCILVMMTYVNYAFYQNIAKVKLGLKEISQSINETRNMAINGYDKSTVNQSIGVLFDLNNKNIITYYAFNYTDTGSFITLNDDKIIKEKKLPDNIGINSIKGKGSTELQNKLMIYFSSIYGKPSIYSFDEFGGKTEMTEKEIHFEISFKDALNFPFRRELIYFKNTNITDY